MSGRPANPSYTPLTWDSGNYAAGSDPWAATAKRTDPGYRFFTPALKAAAQFFNFFFGSLSDVQAAQKTDALAALTLGGQAPAINWSAATSLTKALRRSAWSAKDQTWWCCGSAVSDGALTSSDFGRNFGAPTLGSSLSLADVACDSAGNVLYLSTARDVYVGTRASYGGVTFAHYATAISAAPSTGVATAAYDVTHGVWLALYKTSAGVAHLDTSPTGVTWTAQTLPSGWTATVVTSMSTNCEIATNASGTAIGAMWDDTAALLRIMSSTDGGVTWTQRFASALTFTPGMITRPTYDDVSGIWYMAASLSGAHTSVLKSTDGGVTWAVVVTYTSDVFANSLVALGTLLVMLNYDGRVFYSTNGGATFLFGARILAAAGSAGSPIKMTAGGGGLLIVNSNDSNAWLSTRFGADAVVVS